MAFQPPDPKSDSGVHGSANQRNPAVLQKIWCTGMHQKSIRRAQFRAQALGVNPSTETN
jgi:hypothetical protein